MKDQLVPSAGVYQPAVAICQASCDALLLILQDLLVFHRLVLCQNLCACYS